MTSKTSMEEEWRPVVGFESLYEVSDLGRVRSLDRVDTLGRLRRGGVLRGGITSRGYRSYSLTPKGERDEPWKPVQIYGHVLVLTAFVSPRPPDMEACHDNDTPDDNRRRNLRWDTPEANSRDRVKLRTGLTSKQLSRPRRAGPRGHSGRCARGHLVIAPNVTTPQPGKPNGRCLACIRAHATVNDARRLRGIELDLAAEADRHYARIMPTEIT